MAIATENDLIASAKQLIAYNKTAGRTTVALSWFTAFDLAGTPGAGTIAAGNTTNGVVQTDAIAGYPVINAFGGSNKGYITGVDFGNTVACRIKLMDCLFKVGAIGFTAGTTTLSAQPSYSTRVPGGTDYSSCQLWFEVTTAFVTGTAWSIQVTYTNEAGVTARTTTAMTAVAAAALTLGRMYPIPLQAGDKGVQKIESVIVTNGGTAMTAGAINVCVMRPLWSGRVRLANDGDTHDFAKTGMPEVFADSALYPIFNTDGTALGLPELELEIANG